MTITFNTLWPVQIIDYILKYLTSNALLQNVENYCALPCFVYTKLKMDNLTHLEKYLPVRNQIYQPVHVIILVMYRTAFQKWTPSSFHVVSAAIGSFVYVYNSACLCMHKNMSALLKFLLDIATSVQVHQCIWLSAGLIQEHKSHWKHQVQSWYWWSKVGSVAKR